VSGLDQYAELARLAAGDSSTSIERILSLVRTQLGMDAAFLSHFAGELEIFRAVDGEAQTFGIEPGAVVPLEGTYCARVVDGSLPSLLPDTSGDPRVRDLPITEAAAVGAYVGVPVHLCDGRLYGTLCCLAHECEPTLNERDVAFMHAMAGIVADQLEREDLEAEMWDVERRRIRSVLERQELRMFVQPIYDLQREELAGFEALARFEAPPARPPSAWFEAAATVGLGAHLELMAVGAALELLDALPETTTLALNVSPSAAGSEEFFALAAPVADRLVLEITEHARVENYERLGAALKRLRARGARVAIDDVGAGFASLSHILRLAPDIVKLDLSLTREIDSDPARRALAASLVSFARGVDTMIAAEGIESGREFELLRRLGIDYGQGFFLGRPQPLAEVPWSTFSLN
jgi:EAL domain-containing protein (putative c-di-GMP-specific phosphodiesterase class I)